MATYFKNITTLAELKKEFRSLVLVNHPDRGGSTEKMQELNAAFEQIYKKLAASKETVHTTNTGYETDYEGATAHEYSEHVYNEYGWKGSRCNGNLSKDDITNLIRRWLKETYPTCKFTVNQKGWSSINIHIMKMDFNPFTTEVPLMAYDINTYHWERDDKINARAKDIISNIHAYVLSYNYDNSDSMTDYFDRGFYESIEFGSVNTPFAVEISRTYRTGGKVDPEFKRPIGPAHQALKKSLGRAYFSSYSFRTGDKVILGEDKIYSNATGFYPLTYGGYKTAVKRLEKLTEAGIIGEIIGSKYYYIRFVGYTPETEKALADEDREADQAEKEWNAQKEASKQDQDNATETIQESATDEYPKTAQVYESFELVDYSEKSVAVFGETKPIKDQLKELGGRFNKFLNYGDGKRAGWIFPKTKCAALDMLLRPDDKKQVAQAEPTKESTTERKPMNDGAYMAFASCVQKRMLSAGYEAGRKYVKEIVQQYTMRMDQIRYIAFLLSDFSQRYGTITKTGAA